MNIIVDCEWLDKEIGADDLIILDATWHVSPQGKSARERYLENHIPQAIFWNLDSMTDPDSCLPNTVPTAGRFERIIAQLGVSNDSRVVIYDQQGTFSAPRGWWLFKLFGHERVHVLDGGLPKWLIEKRRTSKGEYRTDFGSKYRSSLCTSRLRGIGDMIENLETKHDLILDVRVGKQQVLFEHATQQACPERIPGSLRLPYTLVLNHDGTFRNRDEIRYIASQLGIDANTAVVTSCGSGVTAAIVAIAFEFSALRPVAIYDGSWAEWSSHPSVHKLQ